MEENILYELGFKLNPIIIFPFIAFLVFMSLAIILPKCKKNPKNKAAVSLLKIIPNTLALCMIVLSLVIGVAETAEYKEIMEGSSNETILYAEGVITNYTLNPDGTESFRSGEIEFKFDPNKFDYGYNISASDGGFISEGKNLKIGYTVYKGENKIVYIENIPEK